MIAERERADELTPILGDGVLVEVVMPDIQPESGAPELAALIPPPAAVYTCAPSTLDRNMEASELAEILAMILGGWSLEVPADKWANLRPDVRRHFKRTA